MKLGKILQLGLGVYLALPGIEDAASGGTLLAPSALVGVALAADALGVKLPKVF